MIVEEVVREANESIEFRYLLSQSEVVNVKIVITAPTLNIKILVQQLSKCLKMGYQRIFVQRTCLVACKNRMITKIQKKEEMKKISFQKHIC
eukprot:403335613